LSSENNTHTNRLLQLKILFTTAVVNPATAPLINTDMPKYRRGEEIDLKEDENDWKLKFVGAANAGECFWRVWNASPLAATPEITDTYPSFLSFFPQNKFKEESVAA